MKRIDERDTMFARMARKEGTDPYKQYYSANPSKKQIDDKLREKPPMGGTDSKYYHPEISSIVESTFGFLSDIKFLSDGPKKSDTTVQGTENQFTKRLKGLAEMYGAKLSGVTLLDDCYYSHRGRTDEHFGEVIETKLPFTFVFAVEMASEYIHTAPEVAQSIAVTKGYVDAAIIGMILTYYIKQLGYEARNHMDGNYLMVLPLAAKAAGLGDIGRHGLLITEKYGSRVRLGAVSTDMHLNVDTTSSLNVQNFCMECGKCAKYCPGKAIPDSCPAPIDGIERWQIIQENCYEKWQQFGSDCGLCMSVCPFSLPLAPEDINAYISNPNEAARILNKHNIQYPSRPKMSSPPDWLK